MKPILIACIAFLGIGLLFIIIGLATHEWAKNGPVSIGLWQMCGQGTCVDIPDESLNGYWRGARAMTILALIEAFLALVCMSVYVAVGLLSSVNQMLQRLPIVAFVSSIAGGIFAILGGILFIVEVWVHEEGTSGVDPGYSLILTMLGGVLLWVGAGLSFKAKTSGYIQML